VFVSDRIGDVIFCTPALRLLREVEPEAQIDVMVQSPAAADVLRGNPSIDRIFSHEEAAAVAAGSRYDVLVDLKRNKVARRCAALFGFEEQRNPRTGQEHEVELALACVERATGASRGEAPRPYALHPDERDEARAEALLAQAGVRAGDVVVGFHMGCNRVARRGWRFWKPLTHPKAWPVERFVALEAELRRAVPGLRVLLTGSPGERALGRRLLHASPGTIDLVGKTSVLELAAVMRRLRLFVTADTGPLHVACAAGVPIVCLFGATPRAWFGPWPPQGDRVVLEGDPVSTIPVAAVRDAVLAQLRRTAPPDQAASASQAFAQRSQASMHSLQGS
jgi:ADP-heptose:LPS heptosyltransferase